VQHGRRQISHEVVAMNNQNDTLFGWNELEVADLPCTGSAAEAHRSSGVAKVGSRKPLAFPALRPRTSRPAPPPTVSSSFPSISVVPDAETLAALDDDPFGLGDAVVPAPRRWDVLARVALGTVMCFGVLLTGFRARRAYATPAPGVHAVAASVQPGPEAIIVAEPLPTARFARPSPCVREAAAAPRAEPRAAQVTRVQPPATKQRATADTSLVSKPSLAPPPSRARNRLFDVEGD
jgi:hypothetical protein